MNTQYYLVSTTDKLCILLKILLSKSLVETKKNAIIHLTEHSHCHCVGHYSLFFQLYPKTTIEDGQTEIVE